MQKLLDTPRPLSFDMSIVIIFRSIHDSFDSRDGNFLLSIVGVETVDLLFDIASRKS